MATYIVYKTINKINGKYYIGKHRLQGDQFDFYFGSGTSIQNALKKYGIENFERITLFETNDEYECFKKEEEILGDLWITDENCYNKQPGGKGFSSGINHYTQGLGFSKDHIENLKKARNKRGPLSDETKRKMSLSRKGSKRSVDTRKKMSIAQSGEKNPMYGKCHSEEKKKEISDKLRGKYIGEKNSRFKGYYVTPFGEFSTVAEASQNIKEIGRSTIREWCNNSNKTITKNMIGISKYLQDSDLGKTFKEIGFYFRKI